MAKKNNAQKRKNGTNHSDLEKEAKELDLDQSDSVVDVDEEQDDTSDLTSKISNLEDKLLRSQAEIDNINKRHIKDLEKAHKFGVENLLIELLPVIDNLEHALNNFTEESKKEDKEGIELVLKSFESTLDKFNISPINPLHEDFDPLMHEAVGTQTDSSLEDNKVLEVLQRGWELYDRVVRPARVIVVKN
tara:strand:+ start:3005 stop:3574 length:570 start_codon:yes stop_codon:yes gene_type:complete